MILRESFQAVVLLPSQNVSIYGHACPICPQSVGLLAYLQSVINQSQDVLDCLLLGDVGHQVQKGLCALSKNKIDIHKLRHSTKTQHPCTYRQMEQTEFAFVLL